MIKNFKRLAQTSKDLMLSLTIDDVQLIRKRADKDQHLIVSYVRGELQDYTLEHKIQSDKVAIGETFHKKTTLWFSSNKVQEKWIKIIVKVRDGPPQPNAKDGGYRQVAIKKVDVGAYGTEQKMNKPNKAAI